MATIVVTLPAENEERIMAGILVNYRYPATIRSAETGEEIQNPETPFAFACRTITMWLKEMVKAVEVPSAALADRDALAAEIDAFEIDIQEGA